VAHNYTKIVAATSLLKALRLGDLLASAFYFDIDTR
jgi:hypothetical protein